MMVTAFVLGLGLVAHAEVVRHALVVGVNKGNAELDPLRYAGDDATRVAEVLAELGGFPSEGVTLLLDPDRKTLEDALRLHETIAAASDEDLFLFYYSGHADSLGLRLGRDNLSYADLKRQVEAIPAEVRLGVLDACQAGGITHTKGMVPTAPFASEDALLTEGDAWLTASAADEAAQESESLKGSFFTHYLISGLRGAADHGDGVVSLDEAYAYAYARTVARTGTTKSGVQHPGYDFRLQGNGDLPLTDVARASAVVIFPEDIAGVITVFHMPDDTPVAEVAKRKGDPAKLGLLPGRYRLRLRDEQGIREAMVGLDAGAELNVRGFAAQEADVASNKGPFETEAHLDRPSSELLLPPALSTLVPGVGQMYNRQVIKGIAFFVATSSAAGTIYGPGNAARFTSGTGIGAAIAPMFWGWSIADAANVAGGGHQHRPMRGWAVGLGATTDLDRWVRKSMSLDWYATERLTLGLTDVGVAWAHDEPDIVAYTGAARAMVILARGQHWQPGVVGTVGFLTREGVADGPGTLATWSGGLNVRYYGTPRYFMELEAGGRSYDDEVVPTTKLGLGVHFGR